MKVVVTGATGFVGYHSARRLREAGHRVTALVRDADKARALLGPIGIGAEDLIVGSMTDEAVVARALDDAEVVVHCAGRVGIGRAAAAEMLQTNVRGAELVVGGAVERGARFVLYVSSMTALFDPKRPCITADSPIAAARSPYGRSKAAAERVVRELQASGAPVCIVYPGGVIGPDDPGLSESVYSYRGFVRAVLQTSGGVSQIDVRDLADLHCALVARGRAGRVVAAGHYLSWYRLAELLERLAGARPRKIRAPAGLLRAAGHAADLVNAVRGTSSQFSGEGMTIATRLPETENSPDLADLGVVLRSPERTLEDMLRWLVSAGRLPARAVPALAGCAGRFESRPDGVIDRSGAPDRRASRTDGG
jgi:nucleoside-diphosphate-sugar epimerase